MGGNLQFLKSLGEKIAIHDILEEVGLSCVNKMMKCFNEDQGIVKIPDYCGNTKPVFLITGVLSMQPAQGGAGGKIIQCDSRKHSWQT